MFVVMGLEFRVFRIRGLEFRGVDVHMVNV